VFERGAAGVMERCEVLGRVSEEPGMLVRPYGSRALGEANDLVAGWMREAGMSMRRDAFGNVIGRYGGTGPRTLILGSHLDTVRDAGKYDGSLGVLVALAVVERLRDRDERLPFAVEVVAFADEEGLRFGTTYLGSSVYAGAFDRKLLSLEDGDGVPLGEAVRAFGGDPEALAENGRDGEELVGYCEVHIEQGPVLERLGLPVGIVEGISSQTRAAVGFVGEAGHAGTVPMEGRRDALCAAAEFVLAVDAAAHEEPGAVATVGEILALPGAGNVIPGRANLSLDVRHADDATRKRLRDRLRGRAREIAASRGCEHLWRVRQESPAVPTDPGLTALLHRAAEGAGVTPVHRLPSGAGHDAAQVAGIAPVAMLFVRCEGGISHNPAESVAKEDVGVALDLLERFVALAAEGERQRPRGLSEEGGRG
jgi:allantoate deiminase